MRQPSTKRYRQRNAKACKSASLQHVPGQPTELFNVSHGSLSVYLGQVAFQCWPRSSCSGYGIETSKAPPLSHIQAQTKTMKSKPTAPFSKASKSFVEAPAVRRKPLEQAAACPWPTLHATLTCPNMSDVAGLKAQRKVFYTRHQDIFQI